LESSCVLFLTLAARNRVLCGEAAQFRPSLTGALQRTVASERHYENMRLFTPEVLIDPQGESSGTSIEIARYGVDG
jgi:hypothetical protein